MLSSAPHLAASLPPLPPLATLPEFPSLSETMAYQLNGLIVVGLALGSIWLLVEIIGAWFRGADRRAAEARAAAAAAAPAVANPTPAATPTATPSDAPELIAVIAAAVHCTLGANARVVSVAPGESSADWAREGRRTIFSSHKVR